jgi:hypothetical protein
VVIDDLNIEGIAAFEAKTDTPLIVDTNAPGSLAVAFEFLKPVLWGNTQIIDAKRAMQHL